MKKILLLAASLLAGAFVAQAQTASGFGARDLALSHEDDQLVVRMTFDLSTVSLDPRTEAVITPCLLAEGHRLDLRPVGVYTRGRFYHYAREQRTDTPFEGEPYKYLAASKPGVVKYEDSVPYEDWMDGAQLVVDDVVSGCCGKIHRLGNPTVMGFWHEPEPEIINFVPNFIYVQPEANVAPKERSISGEAYVTFAAGKSSVDPDYASNAVELAKIRGSIDAVREDPDLTITEIVLRGYSSPDGKYASNEKLAIARTESIKGYVSGLYPLDASLYKTDAVAENWEGLRKAVAASESLKYRDQILDIIDSDLDPDVKESRIKTKYPADYKYLATNVFPGLRRTDYKVGFTVRHYTTVEEVRAILETHPENLSIDEFFLAAQGLQAGTPAFNRVFAIAADVYPESDIANINAANATMAMGDLEGAVEYLEAAGNSPVATYTKGVYEALSGHFDKAVRLFADADKNGVRQAADARALVEKIINNNLKNKK